ncbi:hypothetical protein HD553DRAFT_326347 [Filobasidium floriforme]|uniref:uncharacterized protein n=1 Tax=Filobasidium floriforme TaxID=5210 RepID=UPI001E8E8FA3|nr:uncharacterized protein HD553DRAFT_326347 [Filobasidium floriforme]KAH8079620.1 hypothetical protein HD553DRAFT_326347 [Filobasidium floriforme]
MSTGDSVLNSRKKTLLLDLRSTNKLCSLTRSPAFYFDGLRTIKSRESENGWSNGYCSDQDIDVALFSACMIRWAFDSVQKTTRYILDGNPGLRFLDTSVIIIQRLAKHGLTVECTLTGKSTPASVEFPLGQVKYFGPVPATSCADVTEEMRQALFDIGVKRRRRSRHSESPGAFISHRGSYIRHSNYDVHRTSEYREIVEPFTGEIELFVQAIQSADTSPDREPILAREWVSMKRRAGNTRSLIQKDHRGLSGITSKDIEKRILKRILTVKSQHRNERELPPIVARSAQSYWYISNGVGEEVGGTAQSIASDQDFIRYGLVVDVTWRIENDGEIFEFQKQYGGYIPYVLDLAPLQKDAGLQRGRSLMDDESSGSPAGSSDSAGASLKSSQRSEHERFHAPHRAKHFRGRASGVEDASSSTSSASIRSKPVRLVNDKLSSYCEPSVVALEPSQLAGSLASLSSDDESSLASCSRRRENGRRQWMRPIKRALAGVTNTMGARRGDLGDEPIGLGHTRWRPGRRIARRNRPTRNSAHVRTEDSCDLDLTSVSSDDFSIDGSPNYLDRIDTTSVTELNAAQRYDSDSRNQAIEANKKKFVAVIRATGEHLRLLPREGIEGNDEMFGDWTRQLTKLRQDRTTILKEMERLGVGRGEIQQAELDAKSPARISPENSDISTSRSSFSTDASSTQTHGIVTPCTSISADSMRSAGRSGTAVW